jgi:hypothetical protein
MSKDYIHPEPADSSTFDLMIIPIQQFPPTGLTFRLAIYRLHHPIPKILRLPPHLPIHKSPLILILIHTHTPLHSNIQKIRFFNFYPVENHTSPPSPTNYPSQLSRPGTSRKARISRSPLPLYTILFVSHHSHTALDANPKCCRIQTARVAYL